MKSVEDAYQRIGSVLLDRTQSHWEAVILRTQILGKNCSAMSTEQLGANSVQVDLGLGFSNIFKVSDACILIRDDLLRTTGQRIWGLTFTLYPTGKFNIEYDYNMPEWYEETDEVITGDEINASLGQLTEQDKKPG
ncbi:hypothetical protein [Limnohabitans sp. DM1]|uniref:hypothetical protein n=1 Tax=Limnohabitans sp. DM1 TaxID=1597955 RepID=UPI001892A16F|nr:hypothetical protein [Limnohabitans sp. DM1]